MTNLIIKRILKLVMIILMILGIALSVSNFISADNISTPPDGGTLQSDGTCVGEPLNC